MKTTEAIFRATPKNSKLTWHNIYDLERFLTENEGIELTITMKQTSKLSEKIRMFNFLFGPLLECAVIGYTRAGYEGMDKVKARYKLQAELAKGEIYNAKTGKTEIYLLELSGMSKARLLQFIQDCIFYLEAELQMEVPDSDAYKLKKLTGREMKIVK
jgi:hypothetical protein